MVNKGHDITPNYTCVETEINVTKISSFDFQTLA
jgi:hypothetical protein